jgi:hypothetical protein
LRTLAGPLSLITLLTGCVTTPSVSEYLDAVSPPVPFTSPPLPLTPTEANTIYDEFRGYINDEGVQIGHRHFNTERLPEYFKESNLNLLGDRAEKAFWADQARKAEYSFGNGGLGGGGFGGGGAGAGDLVALVAFVAAAVIVDSVVVYEQDKEVKDLRMKAEGSTESLAQVMESYNKQLADSLGLSLENQDTSECKKRIELVELPESPQLGPNSNMEDWLEDYTFRQQGTTWYFGYKHYKPKKVFSQFDAEDGPNPQLQYRVLPYWGGVLGTIGAVAVALGLSALADPGDYTSPPLTFENGKWFLIGGVIIGSLGLSLEWKSLSLKDDLKNRFNLKMKAKLFPLNGEH